MKTTQTDLPLFTISAEDPNVFRLVAWLSAAQTWRHAAEILTAWGLTATDHNKRYIRALAEQARPEVISGQMGYKHIEHASPEEVHHAAAWFESQAKKMADTATAYRRRAHQIIG